jgi:hypothetical protein
MKHIITFVGLFCCFFLVLAQAQPKGAKMEKGDYNKFETEDATVYRQKVDFQMPTVTAEPEPVTPVNKWQKVEPFFKEGNNQIYVDASSDLNRFIDKHKVILKSQPVSSVGYRVQVFAGIEREQANKMKSIFAGSYGSTPYYMTFVEPTYRIRVGNFLTRNEAEEFCRRVRKTAGLEGAFVVKENISAKK